jgi:ATP-dependent exoDNAse (exonuclease V) beta subunit (contains helicase and exonuclease domains)
MRAALEEIDRGFIGTTHAFCARLLRERPVEAGLDPEFEELDEAAANQLTSRFWNRWYEEQSFAGNRLLAEAAEVGLDRKTLRSAFERVVEYPDVVLVSQRSERPDLRAVCDTLCTLIENVEPHLPTNADRDQPDPFESMIVKLLRQRRSADLDDPFEQFALLDEGNHAKHKPVQKRWPDGKMAKRLFEEYSEFVTNEVRPALRRWREYVHGIALDVLRPAAGAFADDRRRNGTLSFQDLLVCARDLLRDHAGVRRYFQRRFTHVLVDEFQDTDPLQAEVLFYLTGQDVNEKNWRNLLPRPGSLFIVGDPKQSIYRFRRADITTYLDVRDRIDKSGGEIVQLSTNFRSGPDICTFVNDTFNVLFTKDDVDAGRQAEHVDLTHFHEPAPPTGVYALETPDGYANAMAAAEAEWVGQWILRSVTQDLRYSDILLISWQRPRLSYYARVFERLGIPYEITGSKAFKDFVELKSVMPLLRAIVDPDDEVSIVAFLRGALNGAGDDALYRFVRAGGKFSPFLDVAEGTDVRIASGLRVIRDAIQDAQRHPPAAALARLFDRLGLLPLAASRERPGTRSGNLLLALSMARESSARGESLAGIVGQFDDLLESNPDIEELDVDPSRTDAVRLMNLHQVKGLEAPVVFLIDPADEHDFDADLYVDRRGDESRGHFVVTRAWGRGTKVLAAPPGWDGYEQAENEFKRAEKMRLLYVAATRAKRMLIAGYRTAKVVKGAWRELAGRVVARLSMPGDVAPSPATPPPAVRLFSDARDEIAARFASAREASYSVLPITKIAHANHVELVRAEEGLGKGMSWGRVLHRLFEAMLRDESIDIRLFAENLLKDEERDVVELSAIMRVVDAVQSSPLWQRVKSAGERYVEIPFALNVPAAELGLEGPAETLLHGTIDLVFREGNEWFVVDYKTDSTANRLAALTEYYAPQVRLYANFWSRLVNAPTHGGLFFVDGCVEGWVG